MELSSIEPSNDQNNNYFQQNWRCNTCGKVYSSSRSLIVHEKIHTGQKDFVCSYPGCSKAFYIKSMLVRHSHVHSEDRPEHCPYKNCTSSVKSFKTKADIKQHLKNWHSNTKVEEREIKLVKKINSLQEELSGYRDVHLKNKQLMEENKYLKQFINICCNSQYESQSHPFILSTPLSLQTPITEDQKKQIQYIISNNRITPKHPKIKLFKQLKAKKDIHKPKKPMTAYLRFIKDIYRKLDPKISFVERSKKISELWKNLPPDQKQYYVQITHLEMKEYHRKLEMYYNQNKRNEENVIDNCELQSNEEESPNLNNVSWECEEI